MNSAASCVRSFAGLNETGSSSGQTLTSSHRDHVCSLHATKVLSFTPKTKRTSLHPYTVFLYYWTKPRDTTIPHFRWRYGFVIIFPLYRTQLENLQLNFLCTKKENETRIHSLGYNNLLVHSVKRLLCVLMKFWFDNCSIKMFALLRRFCREYTVLTFYYVWMSDLGCSRIASSQTELYFWLSYCV